jgi:hypothetical protein
MPSPAAEHTRGEKAGMHANAILEPLAKQWEDTDGIWWTESKNVRQISHNRGYQYLLPYVLNNLIL